MFHVDVALARITHVNIVPGHLTATSLPDGRIMFPATQRSLKHGPDPQTLQTPIKLKIWGLQQSKTQNVFFEELRELRL